MLTFPGILLNKKREKKIGHFIMDKFKTFYKFLHDRIKITLLVIVLKPSFKYLKNEKN
jgi:hypothetical protein